MKRSEGSSSRGSTYLESLVSIAILGVCISILAPCLAMKETLRRQTEYHQRAISALVSQADLLRGVRGEFLTSGRHEFMQSDKLLMELPDGEASYRVRKSTRPGLMQVRLRVAWEYRGTQQREFEIHVRR